MEVTAAPLVTREPCLLVHSPHPILAAADRRFIQAHFRPGETVAEFLARSGVESAGPCVLTIQGQRVPRNLWAHTRPKPGMLLTLRATVRGGGGGGGGKNPLATVLQIGLMIAAPGLGNAVAGALKLGTAFTVLGQAISWAQIIGGAISVLGGMLINNVLAPPPRPQLQQAAGTMDNPSPTYSLSGGGNRARPYGPMSLVIGKHRVFPDQGAKTFTEFEGDDQYLYEVYHFGLSDVVLSDFRIGPTPIASFADITIQESGADGALTLFPGNVDTAAGGALTQVAGWIQRTSSVNSTHLAVDIIGNLYAISSAGGIAASSATIEMEYRVSPAGAWQPFWQGVSAFTFTSGSRKPIRRTFKIALAAGQYDVRVRRTTADSADPQVVSQLDWSQLRSYQPDTADYTGQKRVALKARATGQLQGRIDIFNALASARCEAWTGAAWVLAETSNPAWWVRWFAKGKTIGGKAAFGALLPAGRIHEENLKAFGAWCAAKNLTVNMVLDRQMNCDELLNSIARLGRGQCTWSPGKLAVVWDAPDQPTAAVFGMGNIRAGTFEVEYVSEKLADEVGVTFRDKDNDYQQDTVYATVPGVAVPVTRAEVDLLGCDNRSQAGREANLLAANNAYRPRRVSFETDFEGLVIERGDVAVIAHDLTQWALSGRLIEGSTAHVLKLDRKVTLSSAADNKVMVKRPDGSFATYSVVYAAGEVEEITLTGGDLPVNPGADPDGHPVYDYCYYLAPLATPGKKMKLVDYEPVDLKYLRLVFMDESPDYYAQENNAFYPAVPGPLAQNLPALSNLIVTEELIPNGDGYLVRLILTWDATGNYAFAKVRAGVGTEALTQRDLTTGRRSEIIVPNGGTANLEVVAFDPLNRTQGPSRLTLAYTIVGKDFPPSNVTGAFVSESGGNVHMGCHPVYDDDLDRIEVRLLDLGDTNWNNGIVVANILRGKNETSGTVQPGNWTFLFAAYDTSGLRSAIPARVDAVITQGGAVSIEEREQAPDWLGTKTNFVQHWTGVLVPRGQNAAGTYAGNEWIDQWVPHPFGICTYEGPEIDKGRDAPARVWGDIVSALGPGVASGTADPAFEIDHRLEAGAYDGFEPWSIGQVSFRRLKPRLVLDTTRGLAKITGFQTVIDRVPVIEEKHNLAIGAGGLPVLFTSGFHLTPSITPLSDDAVPKIPTHTADSAAGTTLHLFSAAGAEVGGTGGYRAMGV